MIKEFKDLEFKQDNIFADSKQAVMNFENGYGVSVILGKYFYSNGIDTYEIAILHDGVITYNTEITDDVIGGADEDEVSEIMKRVQSL